MRHLSFIGQRRRRGLTLIEVMVALGVLVILVGGIFLIVQTSLKTVLMIDKSASRDDEITNLTDILRQGFRNLPARARLSSQSVTIDGTPAYLLVVRNAPGFLSWLAAPEAEDMIVLLAARQDGENKKWRICLKRFVPPENLPEKEFGPVALLRAGSSIPWLELVRDFDQISTHFFDGSSQNWKDQWDNHEERPALIQISFQTTRTRDRLSEAPILWVPPVEPEVSS